MIVIALGTAVNVVPLGTPVLVIASGTPVIIIVPGTPMIAVMLQFFGVVIFAVSAFTRTFLVLVLVPS